jgi:hypothetical protein
VHPQSEIDVNLASIAKRTSWLGLVLVFSICGPSLAAQTDSGAAGTNASAPTLKTIKNPGGGTIVYGRLSGQLTPRQALGETLKRIVADYGDRPQIGSALRNRAGTLWEGFFTVSNKKQGNVPMTGLLIIYAPNSGTAGSATLIDTTANFPMSANAMLQSLVQAVTGNAKAVQNGAQASAPGATTKPQGSAPVAKARTPSGPPEKLTPYAFPDRSGSIGLPPGWTPVGAKLGDVSAKGPNGETLRFGLAVQVLDPGFPQSRTLTGLARQGYVTVRYNQEPAEIFQQAVSQMNRQSRAQPPALTIKQSRDLGGMTQGKNYILLGDLDRHDGAGLQSIVAQVSITPPNPQFYGTYQMKVYQLTAPQPIPPALANAIFASYQSNGAVITGAAIQNLGQIQAQDRINEANFEQQMANTDLMSQGMSDLLRDESVFTDSDTGRRYRGPDDLASALQNANPNRFQTVPLSQYIHGVDY